MIRALLIVVTLALLVAGPRASQAHDHWINHGNYVSPTNGVRCCGEHDCILVLEEQVTITAQGYVLTSGERIPFREALVSEDVYRPQLVRHLIACYAASTAGESWFCRTAAGVWNPCRSMSQVVL
jgi:hypothetical protein